MFASTGSSSSAGGGNFLVPNGTFIIELVIFIVVLGIVAKFILPPIQHVMNERESTVRSALTASDEGQAEANRLVKERRQVLDASRAEARSIVDAATAEVNAMFEDARSRAQTEHDRLVDEARVRIIEEANQLREDSLARLSDLVVSAASQVIGGDIDSNKHRELISEVVSSSREATGA